MSNVPRSSGSEPLVLEDLITYRLMQLSEAIVRAATHVYKARHGITLNELRILVALSGHERLTLVEISQRTRIDKAWISRSLQALIKRGVVSRAAHPTDNRSTLLSLTASGRHMVKRLTPLAVQRHERMLRGLDKSNVYRLINELQKRADDLLAHPNLKHPHSNGTDQQRIAVAARRRISEPAKAR